MSASTNDRPICSGCQRDFTPTGLGFHLRRTTNPPCRKVYLEQQAYVPQLYGNNTDFAPLRSPSPEIQADAPGNFDDPGAESDSDDDGPPGLLEVEDSDDEDGPSAGWEPPADEDPDEPMGSPTNPWAPFASQVDWEVAKWAKLRGSTSNRIHRSIVNRRCKAQLSGAQQTNDGQLPTGRPTFQRQEIVVGGEAFDVYFRPVVDCLKALYGDPEFAQDLVFMPERHYADADKTIRLYDDMHTAEWWWRTQKVVEKRQAGATIVPVMISTDKTQTTLFRNKAAYPVYMTIGNIPKDIRRKTIPPRVCPTGYLPTTRLDHIKNKAARRRAGPISTMPAMGWFGGCHPYLLCLRRGLSRAGPGTATKTGECPTCPVPRDELGSFEDMACVRAGIKPIFHPFWEDLPYVNIFLSITSDVLHQLYQGVIKPVIAWVTEAFGAVEIDARCRRMPPNHNTHVPNTPGSHRDLRLPDRRSTTRLIRAVRASLDFLYLAQYPTQSSETLPLLNTALESFHGNKQIFVDLAAAYDLAKDAYRATNRKDEYTQMTLWLERKEKIFRHDKFIMWRIAGSPEQTETQSLWHAPRLFDAGVSLTVIENNYGAIYFRDAFARYAVSFWSAGAHQPADSVYHTMKFWNGDALGRDGALDIMDTVHIKPGVSCWPSARGFQAITQDHGLAVPRAHRPEHLAYVEWFSAFPKHPEPNHLMYKISKPAERYHLFPQFGPVAPRTWTSQNVLDLAAKFYVNPWSDRHAYITVK
ncbi:hypothetical protein FB451DRAFT_1494005 [Mycena latifolia]|nr:hypothetical protein FB451DRAFT_1494005 [Mycena latifolia]